MNKIKEKEKYKYKKKKKSTVNHICEKSSEHFKTFF